MRISFCDPTVEIIAALYGLADEHGDLAGMRIDFEPRILNAGGGDAFDDAGNV